MTQNFVESCIYQPLNYCDSAQFIGSSLIVLKGPLAGFAMIELTSDLHSFNPLQVYPVETLEFDSPSNFLVVNGKILTGLKNRVIAIDLVTTEIVTVYKFNQSEGKQVNFDVVAAMPFDFQT